MKHEREAQIIERLMGEKFRQAAIKHDAFVAGGAVRSVFTSDHINDLDIFFPSQDAVTAFMETLDENESPTFSKTDSALTHMADGSIASVTKGMRYQLIVAEFGNPQEVIDKFDFTCCMGAFVPKDRTFVLGDHFLKHSSQRRLCFNASAGFPICSLWRAAKFVKRGWKFPAIEVIKLALSINHLDLKTHGELKRQLMGIDTMLLKELTDTLEADKMAQYDYEAAIEMLAEYLSDDEPT